MPSSPSKWQSLPTEAINPASLNLDKAPIEDIIDLMINEDRKVVSINGRIEEIAPQAEPDPAVARIVSKYAKLVDDELNTKLGETEVWLDGLHVRSKETNLGNLIADIVRTAAGAEAAIIAGIIAGLSARPPSGRGRAVG